MRRTQVVMGMPVTIEIVDVSDPGKIAEAFDAAFGYFEYVDATFSTYKEASEISRINRGEIKEADWSPDMRTVFELAAETKIETQGYFDIVTPDGSYDPSGLVKGWSIQRAAEMLSGLGFKNFYVDAGGDIQAQGKNSHGHDWSVGIRDPFRPEEIVKIIHMSGAGVATSGNYIRGAHIYDPHAKDAPLKDIVSLTVVGPNVYEADRFATAAFAMGRKGIAFIEQKQGFEGYLIDADGIAVMTSGFERMCITPAPKDIDDCDILGA